MITPHQPISQKHAQKFLISLSVLKSAAPTVFHPLWKAHLWVSESPSSHSSSLLQDLGYIVFSLHVVGQENMCHVTLDHGGVQGGTCPKRVASPCVLQRSRSLQLSIPGHSSIQLQASPTNMCLVREVLTQLHQLSPYTLSSCMASTSSLPDLRRNPLISQPALILKALPRASYVTSYPAPPMVC